MLPEPSLRVVKPGRPRKERPGEKQAIEMLRTGKVEPSVAALMRDLGRTKQEARTDLKHYEKLRPQYNDEARGAVHEEPERPKAKPQDHQSGSQRGPKEQPGLEHQDTAWLEIIPEKMIALGVGGLGMWLAYIQLGINYEFWRSQGQTLGAKDQFGYVGIIIEILLNTLLPARRILRNRGEKWWSHLALLALFFCLFSSTYAAWNFATRNIDDGAARRQDATQKIAKLQTERDDFARLQITHSRDGRLNAARLDGDQIQARENQIRELQPKAGTTAPDVFNIAGKVFYTCIPTLSGILIMIAFIGLERRKDQER